MTVHKSLEATKQTSTLLTHSLAFSELRSGVPAIILHPPLFSLSAASPAASAQCLQPFKGPTSSFERLQQRANHTVYLGDILC